MNKSERARAIETEANEHMQQTYMSYETGKEGFKDVLFDVLKEEAIDSYIAGTNSRANAEYLIRRAVELAREWTPNSYEGQEFKYESVDEVLAELLKEINEA